MKLTIATKIAGFLLLAGLLPLAIVGYLNYQTAVQMMTDQVEDSLDAFASTRAAQINSYFDDRRRDVELLAHSPDVIDIAAQLIAAFKTKGADSEEYAALDSKIRSYLVNHMETKEYHDLFVISPEGDIVFTIIHEPDFGTNLRTGPYQGTELANSFIGAAAMLETAISDFQYYQASNEPAAFIAAPVYGQGGIVAVLAVQMSTQAIYSLVQDYAGLGSTGETIIVSRVADQAVVLNPLRRDPDAAFNRKIAIGSTQALHIQQAAQGKKGVGLSVDFHDQEILAAWRYLPHLRMGMVVTQEISEVYASVYALRNQSLGIGLAIAVALICIAVFLARSFSVPIKRLTKTTELMAAGDLTVRSEVRSRDEIGMLGKTFNSMVESLRKHREENRLREWSQVGMLDLGTIMSGNQGLAELSRNIVTFLAKYLGAQIGALYLVSEEGRLQRVGSYAFAARKGISNEVSLGEGLVGQAALEQESIMLTEVPSDYVDISSALGHTPPRNILVFPVVRQNELKAVLELGSLLPFPKRSLHLLDELSNAIAIAIDAGQSREQLQRLHDTNQGQLEELRIQTEELQVQHEELRVANETLETKTRALETSEEQLKQQSEELQVSNEELEEKTEFLERQQVEIEEKAKQLATAGKYKSEFLANMSHELRTPLNSLLILAKSLADNCEGNLTGEQVKSANIIHAGGQELLSLINDVLDLSKVEAGKLGVHTESLDLREVADALHRQFAPLASERSLVFQVEVDQEATVRIDTDRQRIKQILKNLLSNAFKFTHQGSVTLRIECPGSQVRFTHGKLTPAEAVGISVVDTGIGVPQHRQRQIFESFQQADGSISRQYGGTGLGLTISRKLATLLSGEIQFHSREGEGSTFTLYLPTQPQVAMAHQQEALPQHVSRPALSELASAPISEPVFLPDDRADIGSDDRSILVIEDDPRFAQILLDLSRRRGFKGLVAGTGKSGLQMAVDYRLSAVLLDLGLPDIDGMTVLDELKTNLKTRHIPVHIISDRDEATASLRRGACGFLAKPVDEEVMAGVFSTIEQLLKGGGRRLLVVENDPGTQQAVRELLKSKDVEISVATNGQEAFEKIMADSFDCLILDLGLGDMTGFELLRKLAGEESIKVPPVIVYTGSELAPAELHELDAYATSIVVKGAASPERLVDEVSLFLHSVESSLPESQRQVIQMLHDPGLALKEKKILVVDDDMRNSYALAKVLGEADMQVTLAENGKQALEMLEGDGEVDMVLMDIMMPVMDGYEAMRQIRQNPRFTEMPIIALTAKAMPEDRTRCIEAGASDYLSKPVDVEKLLSLARVWGSK